MLSLTCKTAIKAILFLASERANAARSGIVEIAGHIDASEHTVGKILQTLVKENVIRSAKGPNGGFYLTAKQKEQPVINVIYAIDGKQVFKQCGLGLSKCAAIHPCPIHIEYKIVRDSFETLCRKNKVSDLCRPVNEGIAYLMG